MRPASASVLTRSLPRLAAAATTRRTPSHGLLAWRSHSFATESRQHALTPSTRTSEPPYYGEGLPQVQTDDRRVSVEWTGSVTSNFHHIWLRDHCRCSECFHPVTKQRMLDTFSIPPSIRPSSIQSEPTGLQVIWQASGQPHVSVYPWPWLQHSSYDPPLPEKSVSEQQCEILWDKRIASDRPTAHYEQVMEDEVAVLDWLRKTDQFGMCFVEGVPPTTEATEALSRRISHIRETQYGTLWSFTSNLAHGDTAYTNIALPAHTDTTYYAGSFSYFAASGLICFQTDPCGLQIFHLLSHTDGSGGQTLLVDGFRAASELQKRYPTSYELLCRVQVPSHSAGDGDNLYHPKPSSGHPVLTCDAVTGQLLQVRWNNNDRSVMNALSPSIVEEWYQAMRDWNRCLTEPAAELWVQLQPGTAVVINNQRVLHGRAAFSGRRQLCGAYIGGDDWRSKLRVLEEKVGHRIFSGKITEVGDTARERSVWDPAL